MTRNNEFVSDRVIAAAKANLEMAAEHGHPFIPIAISDTGKLFLMNKHETKQEAYRFMGTMAFIYQFEYVVYLMDVRIRKPTDEEAALFAAGRGKEIQAGKFPENSDEALVFLVMPFTDMVKGATGMWKYARLGGCIGWEGKAPHFEPQVWTETGFYKWTMDGYKDAEAISVRTSKGGIG